MWETHLPIRYFQHYIAVMFILYPTKIIKFIVDCNVTINSSVISLFLLAVAVGNEVQGFEV